jgi:preprotein translocase subunit YajC
MMIEILAQDTSSGSPLTFLIFLLPIGALFFLMRSQRRKMAQQQELQRSVEVGDDVLTTAGFFGTVVQIDEDDDTLWVEIAPGTRVHMVRGGIARTLTEDAEESWEEGEEEEERDEDVDASADDEGTTNAP